MSGWSAFLKEVRSTMWKIKQVVLIPVGTPKVDMVILEMCEKKLRRRGDISHVDYKELPPHDNINRRFKVETAYGMNEKSD
jgi:hypothetical protein